MRHMTYAEAEADTKIEGSILLDGRGEKIMYLTFGEGSTRVTFHVEDTAFLDKLANEAERLCREYVGDVPPLEPLHATGQHCECGECEVASHGGPDVA